MLLRIQESLTGTVTDLEPTCSEQTGLKRTLPTVLQDDDLTLQKMIDVLTEDISPETLHRKTATTGPNPFHRILRDFLVFLGNPYQHYVGKNRISWGLVAQLFTNDAERETSRSFLVAITTMEIQVSQTLNKTKAMGRVKDFQLISLNR